MMKNASRVVNASHVVSSHSYHYERMVMLLLLTVASTKGMAGRQKEEAARNVKKNYTFSIATHTCTRHLRTTIIVCTPYIVYIHFTTFVNPKPTNPIYNPNTKSLLCITFKYSGSMGGVKRARSGLQRQQEKESQELQGEVEKVEPTKEISNDVLGFENRKSPLETTTFIPKSGRIWKSQAQRQKASQQRREGNMICNDVSSIVVPDYYVFVKKVLGKL